MSPDPFLGVLFHWLGRLASGSFFVPYKGVKKWAWETTGSWIICSGLPKLIVVLLGRFTTNFI